MRLHEFRLVRALVCASMLISSSPSSLMAQNAQHASAAAPMDVESTIQNARESIKNGRYDQAIETLQDVIKRPQQRTETLRVPYLLLIEAFVYRGNDFRCREPGRQASLQNYEKARALIAECLRVRELRHTRPEPATDYPDEMVASFKDVRAQIFGSFRVSDVSPAGAVVLFDADTLKGEPGSAMREDTDLAVGQHRVIVHYPGYREVAENVTIAPGSTLEQPYHLTRPDRRVWYASGAAVFLAGGLAAILGKKAAGTGTTTAQPLGGPPPPPARPQ